MSRSTPKGSLGRPLGLPWGSLGLLWAVLSLPWASLGILWAPLGSLEPPLGVIWASFGFPVEAEVAKGGVCFAGQGAVFSRDQVDLDMGAVKIHP